MENGSSMAENGEKERRRRGRRRRTGRERDGGNTHERSRTRPHKRTLDHTDGRLFSGIAKVVKIQRDN